MSMIVTREVAMFGDQVAEALARTLGTDLVGLYFVGSVALGGYVPGESDIDIAAVSSAALTDPQRQSVAAAVIEASAACPARGVEFTLYRREVAGSRPEGADFEVNANGGPRMPTAVHLDSTSEPGFWYVLDRAIAHRSGVTISGPPSREIFADVPRSTLLEAMHECPTLHLQPPTVTVRLRGPVQAVCGSGPPARVRACPPARARRPHTCARAYAPDAHAPSPQTMFVIHRSDSCRNGGCCMRSCSLKLQHERSSSRPIDLLCLGTLT